MKLGILRNLASKERLQAMQSVVDGSPTGIALKMLEQGAEIPEFGFASGTAVGVLGLRVDVIAKPTVLQSPVIDVI